MDAKSIFESGNERIDDVIYDPCTNAGNSFLDALKKPLNGELSILIGGIFPPFNGFFPRLLNKADDSCTNAT